MRKLCTNCRAEYFERWRNEPTTFCVACRADVVLCSACTGIIRGPIDAAQLPLWPMMTFRSPGRLLLAAEKEPHFSHGTRATNAERKKYPFH